MHDQRGADLRTEPVPELDHLAKLVCGIDVQQRERNSARVERLLGQPHHDRRILADGVQHYRALKLGHDLAQDVNAFGFEHAQVGQGQAISHMVPLIRCCLAAHISRIS